MTRRRYAIPLVAAAVLATLTVVPASAASTTTAAPATPGKSLGSVPLHRCDLGVDPAAAWCGRVQEPLDRTDATAGTLTVGFGWVPASGHSVGTVLAMEGGPGYPSTGTAPDFLAMIGPLHADHDLLVVDARGTGRSTRIVCKALQDYAGSTATDAFRAVVRGCADQLDHTFRRTDGSWVHAADLFGTANVARDTADVVRRLGVGPVDLFGDSYGSWFAQVFTARFPGLLRSVTLDATYEVRDLDPWYVTSVQTARTAFDAVCQRGAACRAQAPGSSWARIGQLATYLRAHPVSGWTTGLDADRVHVTVDVRALVDMVNDAGYDYGPYRTLDAAARALLDHGDAQPLLRQWAQDLGWDDGDYSGPASVYTDGDYYAVACTDYPQLFDPTASPATRRAQLAAAVRALPADTFAPFTTAEWLQVNQYTEAYTACLDWPAPVHHDPPLPSAHAPLDPGGVPVLVLNGDLDSLTPATGGAHVAQQVGPAARALVARNMVHLVALDDPYGCGASVYQQFVTHPERLRRLDTRCLARIPEVRAIGSYPSTLAQVAPARVVGGTSAGTSLRARRLAALAVAAVGDATARWNYVDGDQDLGLRGGHVHYREIGDGTWLSTTLRDVVRVAGVTVSGTVRTSADGFAAHGSVLVDDGRGAPLRVTLSWSAGASRTAHIQVDGAELALPAP